MAVGHHGGLAPRLPEGLSLSTTGAEGAPEGARAVMQNSAIMGVGVCPIQGFQPAQFP